MALKRALRLRKSSEFRRVGQQGRRVSSSLLILAWMPNDVGSLRIGFVVSKRISKRAVDRNYIKRLLGEAIRDSLAALSGGWDIVISARKDTLKADLPALTQEVAVLLRRARLIAAPREPLSDPARRQNMQP